MSAIQPVRSARTAASSPQASPAGAASRVAPSLAEVYRSVPDRRSSTGGGRSSRSPVPAISSPSATWIRATGPPTSPADRAFGYTLLSVILISNLMAVLLQGLASKLGIVTGRDLAQACRDHYSHAGRLSRSGSSARSPSPRATSPRSSAPRSRSTCCSASRSRAASRITALDVLLVLYLQNKGFRLLEALVITLVATVGVCFLFEIFLARPDIGGVHARLHPDDRDHHRSARCSTSPSASSARR